jgi:hypothetical protein
MTSALDGGEWSASRPERVSPPGTGSPVPGGQETGWAPEPVWTQRLEERSFASAGDRIWVAQSVARHYTDWATPVPFASNIKTKLKTKFVSIMTTYHFHTEQSQIKKVLCQTDHTAGSEEHPTQYPYNESTTGTHHYRNLPFLSVSKYYLVWEKLSRPTIS